MPLSVESKFLLRTLRRVIGAGNESRGIDKVEELDSNRLLSFAHFHHVVPLVFKAISGPDREQVASRIVEDFRADVTPITVRSLCLTKELLNLVSLFEEQGVLPVAFKGPLLSLEAYGALSARQFEDIDLIVPKADFEKACSLMYAEGYKGSSDDSNACGMFHPKRRVAVDLHRWIRGPVGFAAIDPATLDSESLLARSTFTTLQGQRIRTPRMEDLVVALCMHASRHAWQRWIWLFDIAALIQRHPELDWDELARRAHELGVEEPIYLSLQLLETVCGSPVPAGALGGLRVRPRIKELIPSLTAAIIQDPNPLRSDLRRYLLPFQTMTRAQDKVTYVFRLLKEKVIAPTNADYTWVKLPRSLHVLYFGIRPFRLIYEHGSNAAGYIVMRLRGIQTRDLK